MTITDTELRLHSIMLGVRDINASIAFYTDVVGLDLRGRFEDFAMLDLGGTTLMLSAQLARARPSVSPAPVEVVIAVAGVRAAFETLRARGAVFLSEPHTVDGTNDVANFEDPDGHLFSFYGAP